MQTIREKYFLELEHGTIDNAIESLKLAKKNLGEFGLKAAFHAGMNHRCYLEYARPMTKEEIEHFGIEEHCNREQRKREYEKLKKEFDV
jgi:hypothetical protein